MKSFGSFLDLNLPPQVVDILLLLGLLKILSWIWELLSTFNRHFLRPCCQKKDRLYKNYGLQGNPSNRSWAVVTGGSDGIGLAMCKNLAKQGFNVCIVSRDETKINDKLDEIKKECRPGDASFRTMSIVADFLKMRTLEEYRSTIATKLQSLDVAVLVLNAGYQQIGEFKDITDDEVERITQVNVNHVIYTSKVMIGQLLQRHQSKRIKSAIVVVTSMASHRPISGSVAYCAAKSFSAFIGQGLYHELKGKVDVISYKPAGVATKMSGETNANVITVMPETSAEDCFRDLGIRNATTGNIRHEIMATALGGFPDQWVNMAIAPEFNKVAKKQKILNNQTYDELKRTTEGRKKND